LNLVWAFYSHFALIMQKNICLLSIHLPTYSSLKCLCRTQIASFDWNYLCPSTRQWTIWYFVMMLCLLLVLIYGMPTSFLNNKVTHFFTCQCFLLSKKLFEKQLGPNCPICNLVLTFISNSSVHILFFQLKSSSAPIFV